jgi:TRAP-type uncharacterized transport system substrate-binding protein
MLIYDEFRSIYIFCKNKWGIAVPLILATLVFLYYHNPVPPTTVTMATGLKGSSLEMQGMKYKRYFAENGITLELIETAGASANLTVLAEKKVDAALSQGGLKIPHDSDIVSLGSIGYQPLWFFYKKTNSIDNLFKYMEGKQISIAQTGSGTRPLTDDVLALVNKDRLNRMKLLELNARDSINMLDADQIDGMFFVADLTSANLQMLLKNPTLAFLNFKDANALAKNIKHTEVVSLPIGSVDLTNNLPADDVNMIATTTILLINKDLHPGIQHLFLIATKNIQKNSTEFFSRPGGFPTFLGNNEPRSEIAVKYFNEGNITLEDRLPFWLASSVNQMWFFLVASLAVIYPLFSILPQFRRSLFNIQLTSVYIEIFELYRMADHDNNPDDIADMIERCDVLRANIDSVWIPRGCHEIFNNLLTAFSRLEDRINIVKQTKAQHGIGANRPEPDGIKEDQISASVSRELSSLTNSMS